MIRATAPWPVPTVTIYKLPDPQEIAEMAELKRKGDINHAAFEKLIPEIDKNCRDKFDCVAGGQLFVADSSEEVLAMSTAAFPDDNAFVFHYIPKYKLPRIY